MTLRSGAGAGGGRLLLIGVSVRALALSASRAGLTRRLFPGGLLALDTFADRDLLALPGVTVPPADRVAGKRRSVLALGRAALRFEWDGCVVAGGLENRPALLQRLAGHGALLGNDPARVRALRDPAVFFGFLRRAGIPHPATRPGAAGASVPRRGVFLWKPRRSGGGGRIRRASPGEIRPRGFYLQERVRGTAGSAVFVARPSAPAEILGVCEQLAGVRGLGGGGFRYGGNIAGPPEALLAASALAGLEETVRALARRFGLRGLNGVDFIVAPDGAPRILEVNPRWTASMEILEEVRGDSLFDRHLIACLDLKGVRPSGLPRHPAPFLAKGILYATRRIRGPEPERLAALGCRDLPAAGEIIAAGRPVCTVVAGGTSRDACHAALLERAAAVRRLCYDSRTRRDFTGLSAAARPTDAAPGGS